MCHDSQNFFLGHPNVHSRIGKEKKSQLLQAPKKCSGHLVNIIHNIEIVSSELYVHCTNVCHTFSKPYILQLPIQIDFYCQNKHFTDFLIKYKIIFIKNTNSCFIFFQKQSLFLYKSLFSTTSLNICQDIHFTDTYEIWNL